MRIIEMMGKEVSGNSALVADEIAGGIQKSAVAVRDLVIIVLIIPALFRTSFARTSPPALGSSNRCGNRQP